MYNYDTGAFRGYCVLCGDGHPKRELDRVLIQNGRYGSPKIMAYVCRGCSSKVADYLGVELPDVDAVNHRFHSNKTCPNCKQGVSRFDRYCRYCGRRLPQE